MAISSRLEQKGQHSGIDPSTAVAKKTVLHPYFTTSINSHLPCLITVLGTLVLRGAELGCRQLYAIALVLSTKLR